MSDFSDFYETAICNLFRGTNITAPTAVYVALFSVMPGEDGTGGTEVTTTIRAAGRVAATFGAPATSGAGKQIANSADVDFGAAAGSTTVVGYALYDAASAGNMLVLKAFGSSQGVSAGANVKFATGSLTLTVN